MAQVADGKEACRQAGGLHKDTATNKHPGAQGGGLSLGTTPPTHTHTHIPALCVADPAQGCPENTSHPDGRQPARAARGQLSGHQVAVRLEEPAPSLQSPQQACPLGESRAQHQKAPSRPGRGGGSVSTLSCIISFLMVRVCMVYLSLLKTFPSIHVLILKLCRLVTAYGGVMVFLSSDELRLFSGMFSPFTCNVMTCYSWVQVFVCYCFSICPNSCFILSSYLLDFSGALSSFLKICAHIWEHFPSA